VSGTGELEDVVVLSSFGGGGGFLAYVRAVGVVDVWAGGCGEGDGDSDGDARDSTALASESVLFLTMGVVC